MKPQLIKHKTVAMATPVAYQRGHKFCMLWPHISKTIRFINLKLGTYIQHDIPVKLPISGKIGQR